MKIALIGTYPPPYGGRSIHIQRLKEQLEKKGIDAVVYNIGGKLDRPNDNIIKIKNKSLWFLRYFFLAKEDIIHFHSSDWIGRVIIGLMSLIGKKTVVSLHSSVALKGDIIKGNWCKKFLIKLGIRHTSFVIAVNPKIKELVLSLGVPKKKIDVIPSFSPPTVKKEDIDKIPQSIWDFIDTHTPVISANGFKIVFYNNQDLYGIDMCVELCTKLKSTYPQIGFVFCLPEIGDYDYFHKMKKKIADKNIESNFLFVTKPYQLYPILMKSDLFVRPTNTDGYGVSIAEAIYLKVPATASDVCARPNGTILFKSRDIDDFTLKVKDILINYKWHKKRVEAVEIEDNFEKIVRIYQKLINVVEIEKINKN